MGCHRSSMIRSNWVSLGYLVLTAIVEAEMEVAGGRARRRMSSRDTSPDRARLGYSQQQQQSQPPQRFLRALRKVQVVYYLSRNGQLEHPHFIELPYLPSQQLRLRDVMERLTLLRGKGMPSLFSWSCKRYYKNGYVWNDLADSDVIYPADGIEYVLKGSEIIPGAYERFQHVPAKPKRIPPSHKLHLELDDEEEEGDEGEEEGTEEEEPRSGKLVAGDKTDANCSRYPRRSRGVSTDEIERVEARAPHHHGPTELPLNDSSPPSSTSSDKPLAQTLCAGGTSQRFEDGDPTPEPGLNRNSVFLQLIACGSAALKPRSTPSGGMIKAAAGPGATSASGSSGGRRSSGLHRGVVSRFAGRAAAAAADEEEMRCVVADNPRFCHPLVEDKEYFSGSIVEGSRAPPEPALKKSSSYNEERSTKLGIGAGKMENGEEERGGELKGKCIPGRRKSYGKQHATVLTVFIWTSADMHWCEEQYALKALESSHGTDAGFCCVPAE
ncbi:protein UPSTREAM OF FLC [Canna indica]|uniref:Protein UPSTREAM OF FLC n=1 Tax=Canna indica TaxID=4628 RepID=A0AAQ3Q875_9LILI|nr:protein UPSTREAM OF FLC [Canna indica]